ncbi:hypothetical protein ACFXNW_04060 [Nocardia sp. NPDC059180]|uniref:hypothetical protein n=1 Tax=Nocardia sp. NPDC059180 TaxID=3346761 RepID=UPI0036C9E309
MNKPDQARQTKRERGMQANLITDWVMGRLLAGAQPGWARIGLTATLTRAEEDYKFSTLNRDGTSQVREIPNEVFRAFPDLRDLLYEEQEGSWFALRLECDESEVYNAMYVFDEDPLWDPPIPSAAYIDDLGKFPRSSKYIPRWLQRHIDPETALPPVAAGDFDAQEHFRKSLFKQIKLAVPFGWEYVQIKFRMVGDHAEIGALLKTVAGPMLVWNPPSAVTERFQELRASMANGSSTWFSATAQVDYATRQEKLDTNRSEAPQWINAPTLEDFATELRRVDGERDRLPEWITSQLE